MEILTAEQMRRVDRRTIDGLGIPGLLLMDSAGRGVVEALLEDYPDAARRGVIVLCGKGNNGGDGFAAARHLLRRGIVPQVVLLAESDRIDGDAAVHLRALRGSGLAVLEVPDEPAWIASDVALDRARIAVDALLGTGARGGARGLTARVIEDVNRAAGPVVSIDLPSGLDADTQRVEGITISAERTYTLCRPKLALVFSPAAERAGQWRVIPIGIPDEAVREEHPDLEWLDREVARPLLPRRAADSHKGTYGHLLAVAGSRGKSGAAVLLARGALGCGVGLVTVATPASSQAQVAVQQAELMTEPLPETVSGSLNRRAAARARELLSSREALAIGPGLGGDAATRAAARAIVDASKVPTVVDADGLNALAPAGTAAARARRRDRALVFTPHPGEAGRLLGRSAAEVQSARLDAARELARRTGATVVLKGHRTIVARPDGAAAVNASGNPGMATGGTGDVLTGAVGAFLARGLSPWDAARLAVWVHGDAGDRAARERGLEGLLATDVIDRLGESLAALARPEPAVRPW